MPDNNLPKLPEPVAMFVRWSATKNEPANINPWVTVELDNYAPNPGRDEQQLFTADQMREYAQEAARQAMERCDHLQLLFNASKLGHEQAFASSQRAHSALSALQRDLNIMLASAVPEGGEWVEGYRIKTGALHRIIGTMQEAGYSVVLPTLPPPPASVNGEGGGK